MVDKDQSKKRRWNDTRKRGLIDICTTVKRELSAEVRDKIIFRMWKSGGKETPIISRARMETIIREEFEG